MSCPVVCWLVFVVADILNRTWGRLKCKYFFSDSTKQARRPSNIFFEWWVFSVVVCGQLVVGRGKGWRGIANHFRSLAHVGVRACVVISTRVVMSARGWVGACACALRGRVCS